MVNKKPLDPLLQTAVLHSIQPEDIKAAVSAAATAPGPKYNGIWRSGTDPYYLWAGADWTGFVAKWQELSGQNLRLVDIDVYDDGAGLRYIGVWRQGSDAHYLWAGVDWNGFVTKWQELSQQNLRLVSIKTYVDGGVRKYAGVWRTGSDGHYLWAGADWNSFVAKWQQLGAQNLRLTCVDTYVEGGIRKYIGVWRAGTDGYYLWNGVDWNGFVAKWQELGPQNLRLVDMCSYVEDGIRKYLGVWRGGTDGYALYGGLSWDDFVTQWQSLGQQNQRLARIERYVPKVQWAKALRDALQGKAVGWAYAVNQGGNLVDSGAGGYARAPWESSTPNVIMATTTRMPIASVSKPITAVALLKLLQNNLAALDQPFYPYVANRWKNPGAGVNTVTLRNLLTMKSGMKLQSALFVDYDSTMQDLISSDLVGTPGVTPLYNNGNFSLLGAVIEALSGQSYVTYVQQQIFAPMGIMLSATPPPQSTGILFYKRQVFSGGGAWFPTLTCSTACGGWSGSVLDLMKFMRGVRNHTVLGATATDKMFNEQLGWYATAGAYGTYYQHNGILYTGDGRGLTTGLIKLAADTDAVLFINTWDFDTISLLVQAFDNYWA